MAGTKVYRGETFFRKNESFAIVRFAEPPQSQAAFHSHDFVEICYVASGAGFHVVEGEEYRVAKGDLFLINYEMTHAFYRGGNDQELVTYNLLFKPGFLDESLLPFHDFSSITMSYLFRNCWEEDDLREDLRLGPDDQREFDLLIEKIHREYTNCEAGYEAVIRAHMIELIVKMMRSFSSKGAEDAGQQRKAADIEAALQYLSARYHEPVSLSGLAKRSFLSKNYFAQLFKEKTGRTVSQYIRQMRIDKACMLIRNPDKNWTQVAVDVGYSDYKAFYSAFKKQHGISPNEYLRK